MFACYHLRVPDDMGTFSTTRLEGIRDFLRTHPACPPGAYEVIKGWSLTAPTAGPARRWGAAVKHPDGNVELVQDLSA